MKKLPPKPTNGDVEACLRLSLSFDLETFAQDLETVKLSDYPIGNSNSTKAAAILSAHIIHERAKKAANIASKVASHTLTRVEPLDAEIDR